MLQFSCLLSVIQLSKSDNMSDSKAILMSSNHREEGKVILPIMPLGPPNRDTISSTVMIVI